MNEQVTSGRVFDAIDANGDRIECEMIMSYVCDANNMIYVFYTDNNYDEDGKLSLYASRYMGEEDGRPILEDIIDEREWSLLDEVLMKAQESLNGK